MLAIYDNKIFFLADCSYPDGWRHLSLFNISTNGEANWVYSLETESFYNAPSFSCGSEEAHNLTGHYGSSVALDNSGNIYFGFEDTLYSFDQSGARRWKREFSDRIGVISTPAIWSNNIVYVSTPAIEAINPENGGSLWPQSSNATFDSLPFALNDNAIYSYFVNSIDGLSTVYGVDFSGAENWQRRDLIFSEAAAPLVDVNNNLYVVGHASLHSYLYVFKNEGSEMKTFTVPSEPSLQGYYIAMAEDGTLYLSGRKLFAIK